jgi:hypothetical protein
MAKKQKNKKKVDGMFVFAILILVFTLMVFFIALNKNNLFVLDEKQIPVFLIVSDHNAFNITKGSNVLHFGKVMEENFAERVITAENTYPFPIKYEFESEGNISQFLVFPKEVYLDTEQTIEIPFKTELIPKGTEMGEYSGNILVTVKRFFGGIDKE